MKTSALVLMAIAAAVCMLLSSAPIGLGIGMIFSILFLLLIALHAKSTRRACGIVFLVQVPLWLWLHYWVRDVAWFGWIAIGLYMSIWAPLFIFIVRKVKSLRRISLIFSVPILWVGLECLRGIILFDGYPWYLAGTGLLGSPLVSIASIGNVWLASFLVAMYSAVLATVKEVRWWTWTGLILVSMCFTIYGMQKTKHTGSRLNVTVVQTNVPQDNKLGWTWEEQLTDVTQAIDLTIEAVQLSKSPPSLVIWPETMLPGNGFEIHRLDYGVWDEAFTPFWFWSAKLREVAKDLNTPILLGSQTWIDVEVVATDSNHLRVEPQIQFNSAVLLQRDGTTTRYDKSFLTPFGERIPYIDSFPNVKNWIRELVGVEMLFDLNAGGDPTRFSLSSKNLLNQESEFTFATPICFEDTVPSVVRNLVWENGKRRADAIINLSNDGWFGDDDGARLQHVREARMRCVENMTPMVRAANTGKSCLIDQHGYVMENHVEIRETGLLPVKVFAGSGLPISRFVGDWVAWVCFIGSILLIVSTCIQFGKGQDHEVAD